MNVLLRFPMTWDHLTPKEQREAISFYRVVYPEKAEATCKADLKKKRFLTEPKGDLQILTD